MMTPAEVVECLEILHADALRRRDRDRSRQPAIARPMPGGEEVVVEVEHLSARQRRRRPEPGLQPGWGKGCEEGKLVDLGQLGLVKRHRRPDPAVGVGLHHRIDDFGVGGRQQKRVVLHCGGAGPEHLQSGQHGPQIGLSDSRTRGPGWRLEEHEHLERQAWERTLEVICGGMEVGVDQARNQ